MFENELKNENEFAVEYRIEHFLLTLPSTILGGEEGLSLWIDPACGIARPRSRMAGCIVSGRRCGGRSCRMPGWVNKKNQKPITK